MRKLEYAVRCVIYLLWLFVYVLIAAWVGEGQYHQNSARGAAVLVFGLSTMFMSIAVEFGEIPKAIVSMMLEDDE